MSADYKKLCFLEKHPQQKKYLTVKCIGRMLLLSPGICSKSSPLTGVMIPRFGSIEKLDL